MVVGASGSCCRVFAAWCTGEYECPSAAATRAESRERLALMSANMLFFAARSRSPIKFFALRAGFTSASNTARASAPVRRLGGATPTAASGLAEEDFFPVLCPASAEAFASEAVFDSSSASTCAYHSSSFCCLVRGLGLDAWGLACACSGWGR